MKYYLSTDIGRLRLTGMLEGISLLLLVFVAVPLKYGFGNPTPVKIIGQIHGILFLLFVINTLRVGVEHKWRFADITWKVLVACIIPFGTFYIDRKILSKIK